MKYDTKIVGEEEVPNETLAFNLPVEQIEREAIQEVTLIADRYFGLGISDRLRLGWPREISRETSLKHFAEECYKSGYQSAESLVIGAELEQADKRGISTKGRITAPNNNKEKRSMSQEQQAAPAQAQTKLAAMTKGQVWKYAIGGTVLGLIGGGAIGFMAGQKKAMKDKERLFTVGQPPLK